MEPHRSDAPPGNNPVVDHRLSLSHAPPERHGKRYFYPLFEHAQPPLPCIDEPAPSVVRQIRFVYRAKPAHELTIGWTHRATVVNVAAVRLLRPAHLPASTGVTSVRR